MRILLCIVPAWTISPLTRGSNVLLCSLGSERYLKDMELDVVLMQTDVDVHPFDPVRHIFTVLEI